MALSYNLTLYFNMLRFGAAYGGDVRMFRKSIMYLIRLYKKFISPALPRSCRFYPTCSEYAYTAIDRYGVIKGVLLGLWRIIRCNPFCKGGFDPVP